MYAVVAFDISKRNAAGDLEPRVLGTFDSEAKAERVNQRLRRADRLRALRGDNRSLMFFVRQSA